MTDTTHLSGYLLDYYAAMAEGMPIPLLKRHERDDTYICIIGDPVFSICAYSPTTNPALALPIIEKMASRFQIISLGDENPKTIIFTLNWLDQEDVGINKQRTTGASYVEAALRALVAWKFPDGLPEPVYEK